MATQSGLTPEHEMDMYGCLSEDFLKSVTESVTYDCSGALMVASSLMSDAQEEIERGMTERARKTLNRAKLILGLVHRGRLVGTQPR